MKQLLCMVGTLWVVLAAATPEVSAQAHGGVMPNRMPPPRPERTQTQQHPMDRWTAMPPRQREAALGRLKPERAEKIREQMKKWDEMSPEQKERARRFFNLPPEQKKIINDHAAWMKTIPAERVPMVRKEVNSLQNLSPEARQAEIESPSFNKRFSEEERERIRKLVPTMEE